MIASVFTFSNVASVFENAGFEVSKVNWFSESSFVCRHPSSSSGSIGVVMLSEDSNVPDVLLVEQMLEKAPEFGISEVQIISFLPVSSELTNFVDQNSEVTITNRDSAMAAIASLPVHHEHESQNQTQTVEANQAESHTSVVSNQEVKKPAPTAGKIIVGLISGVSAYILVKLCFAFILGFFACEDKPREVSSGYKDLGVVKSNTRSNGPNKTTTIDGSVTALPTSYTPIAPSSGNNPLTGRAKALVIGNGAYAGMGRLTNPTNDARLLSRALTERGFEVDMQLELPLSKMKDAVLQFTRSLKPDDLALFFFAGHGIEVDGQNYLIPINCRMKHKLDAPHMAFPMSQLMKDLERSRCASKAIYFRDPNCRSSVC